MASANAALRRRISLSERTLNSLASVAMHPRARGLIATAKLDLNRAALRLASEVNASDLENIYTWLRLIEERIERVRDAIAASGPFALPTMPDEH